MPYRCRHAAGDHRARLRPGGAAQVGFGKGPALIDINTDEQVKSGYFVMVLAWSRHQYAELVPDQSVETWPGCHRRAFEHFNGVPARIIHRQPAL